MQDRKALEGNAYAVMVVLTALFERDGSLRPGILAGLLFGA
jgi:hypothetical protein